MATIRAATYEDIPALVELGAQMHTESPHYSRVSYSRAKVTALAERIIGEMRSLVGGLVCFVAEEAGEAVGMLAGGITPLWFGDDPAASDLVVFVRQDKRATMTAVRLVKAFEAWAWSKGAKYINLGTSTGVEMERTAELYRRLGYQDYAAGLVKYKGGE